MANQHNIRFRTGLQALNCSASAFAALAAPPLVSKKISQQYVSQLVAGTREFDSDEDAKEFFRVIDTMTHLQEIVTPRLPIAWGDVLGVQDVLARTFEQRKHETDPMHRRCWFVRLSMHNFLKGFRSDGSVIETMTFYDSEAVAFTDYGLASELERKLKQRDIPVRVELLTCERRQSTITVALEELGFNVSLPGQT